MDRIQSLEVFERVAATGGFTAAAKTLHTSPQLVAHQIKSLETYLGVALFTRTTRKVVLTEAGKAFLRDCIDVLHQWEAAKTSARLWSESPKGLLRVAAPYTYGAEKLAPGLVQFSRLFPEIKVDLVLSDVIQDFTSEGFDAAIRIGPLQDSSLVARPLAPYQRILAASPKYLKEFGRPVRAHDLSHHQCLAFRFGREGQRWIFSEDEEPTPISGSIRINHGNALRKVALQHGGILFQPRVLLEDDLNLNRLEQVLPSLKIASQPMNLLYSRSLSHSRKLEVFIEFALDRFGR